MNTKDLVKKLKEKDLGDEELEFVIVKKSGEVVMMEIESDTVKKGLKSLIKMMAR